MKNRTDFMFAMFAISILSAFCLPGCQNLQRSAHTADNDQILDASSHKCDLNMAVERSYDELYSLFFQQIGQMNGEGDWPLVSVAIHQKIIETIDVVRQNQHGVEYYAKHIVGEVGKNDPVADLLWVISTRYFWLNSRSFENNDTWSDFAYHLNRAILARCLSDVLFSDMFFHALMWNGYIPGSIPESVLGMYIEGGMRNEARQFDLRDTYAKIRGFQASMTPGEINELSEGQKKLALTDMATEYLMLRKLLGLKSMLHSEIAFRHSLLRIDVNQIRDWCDSLLTNEPFFSQVNADQSYYSWHYEPTQPGRNSIFGSEVIHLPSHPLRNMPPDVPYIFRESI